jgi:hypothetical protein
MSTKSNGSTFVRLGLPRRRSNQKRHFQAILAYYKYCKTKNPSLGTLERGCTPDVLRSNQFMEDLVKIALIPLYNAEIGHRN